MTQDEIYELARQAYENCDHIPDLKIPKEFVERFAKLVAAKERDVCAEEADEHMLECEGKSFGVGAAIRART